MNPIEIKLRRKIIDYIYKNFMRKVILSRKNKIAKLQIQTNQFDQNKINQLKKSISKL